MLSRWWKFLGLAATLPALVKGYAATDQLQDADAPQSGYLPNHNMDPAMVASSMAVSWKYTGVPNEIFYAKPLVYTPAGASNEYTIVVSNMNIVRVLDGLTGAVISSRTLDPPFQSPDTNCGDIQNFVGIIGTPIIDPATDIMYFFSKSYKGGAVGPFGLPQGVLNGLYRMYAVKIPSLVDAMPPVVIDGHNANNDPTRYFLGGTVLQRPGLAMLGNTIVAGFGGHCDNWNYTGMLVTVSKTPGVGVTNIQAMCASPGASSPQTLDVSLQGGGKAGIWQGGMGLAADTTQNRIYLLTGNSRGPGQNKGASGPSASGKTYLSTLEQAAVNFAVNPSTGALQQSDYFESYAYDSLNGGDRDFGSSGIACLDPTVFNGGGVNRVCVAGGKDGRIYILDADNLGGFAGGAAGGDNVVQVITTGQSLLSGAGSYPGEGGYLYFNPAGDLLYAYKFGRDGNGKPLFTLAGSTAATWAGKSVPTITSNNGQAGSGIVWLTDVNAGLVAFKAVPVNGVLVPITLPAAANTGGLQKLTRVAFGNARAYVVKQNIVQMLSGGGQTSAPSMSCTPNPIAFGNKNTGAAYTLQVTCTALTALTNPTCTTSTPTFKCPPTMPNNVANGATFNILMSFDLTDPAVAAYQSGKYGVFPGGEADNMQLSASVASGFQSGLIVPMTGTAVAANGYLTIDKITVDFGGVTIPKTATSTITLSNKGANALTFTGFDWTDFYITPATYQNVTVQTTSIVGNGYTANNFPAVSSTIAAGATLTVSLTFTPDTTGKFASYLYFWSTGGNANVLFQGAGAAAASSTSKAASSTGSTTSKIQLTSSPTPSPTTTPTPTPTPSPTTTAVTPTGSLNPAEPKTIGTWNYIGCYQDLVGGARSLSSPQFTAPMMTLELCANHCVGYDFFGITYKTQCYCGYTLSPTLRATESDCNSPCPGNTAEICGRGSRLSTYQNSIYYPPPGAPQHVPVVGSYVWQGCYTEASVNRALMGGVSTGAAMTVETCVAYCSGAGYAYAGVEFSTECYCGNVIDPTANLTATIQCSSTCGGSGTEYCGGPSRLDVYKKDPNAASSIASSATPTSTSTTVAPTQPVTTTASTDFTSSTASTSSTSFTASTSSTASTGTATSSTSTASSTSLPYITPPAPKTIPLSWSIGWVNASPDGTKRPMIGINGVWPNPAITGNMGDKIKLTLTNNLGNESTALHFHGLFQINTTYADGPAMVTQCPILPGQQFVYQFSLGQPGTYWYHAHIGGQYVDGFRGPIIVNDVNAPYRVDTEIVMTLSDLYHDQAPNLINYYQSTDLASNYNGAEPVPDSILINEAQNVKFTIVPGKKYAFRIINMGAFAPQYLQFDQHDMTIVEVDGVYCLPTVVTQLFVAVAQRYTVVITAKSSNAQNFIVRAKMSTTMFNSAVIPADMNTEVTAWLVYNAAAALPAASSFTLTPKPFDDSVFQPVDAMPMLPAQNNYIQLAVSFGPNTQGQWRGFINGISYVSPKVPTLYSVLSAPVAQRNNPAIYGTNTNPVVLKYNQVVELQIENHDSFAHPFHLHGHNFQVIDRTSGGPLFPLANPVGSPMRRDVFVLHANGFATIRFVANNPGIALFHCHIEWHVESGLTMTFIEAPDELVALKPYIPASHRTACSAAGIAMKGNAAGNTVDFTNLAGQNTLPPVQAWGALVNPPTSPAPPYHN